MLILKGEFSEMQGNNRSLKIIRLQGPFKHYWDKLVGNLGRDCCIVKVVELGSLHTSRNPHEKASEISKLIEVSLFLNLSSLTTIRQG